MGKEEMLMTFIAALISGLIATIISNMYYSKQKKLQKKIDLLDDIFGYRYQLAEGYTGTQSDIIRALNRIPIVFAKSKEIIKGFYEYHQAIQSSQDANDRFVSLLKNMCLEIGVDSKGWNDSYVKAVFSAKK